MLQGKYRVYIDPYSANVSANQYYVVGYKGSSPLRRRSILLPLCSPPNGSRRWSGHLPTQDWIQDSLRHRREPLLSGCYPGHGNPHLQLQPLLSSRQGCQPHVILALQGVHFQGDPSGSLFLCLHSVYDGCYVFQSSYSITLMRNMVLNTRCCFKVHYSASLQEFDNRKLEKDIYELKEIDSGVSRFNKNGWHSESYETKEIFQKYMVLGEIFLNQVIENSNSYIKITIYAPDNQNKNS